MQHDSLLDVFQSLRIHVLYEVFLIQLLELDGGVGNSAGTPHFVKHDASLPDLVPFVDQPDLNTIDFNLDTPLNYDLQFIGCITFIENYFVFFVVVDF